MAESAAVEAHRRAEQFLRTDALLGVPYVPVRRPTTPLDEVVAAYRQAAAQEGSAGSPLMSGEALRARIVFVREAPSDEEVAVGRPGVGLIGGKVRELVRAMRLGPGAVRVTFLSRPGDPVAPIDGAGGAAEALEVAWLDRELAAVRPQVVVAMGPRVATRLCGSGPDSECIADGGDPSLGAWRTAQELSEVNRSLPVLSLVDPAVLVDAPSDDLRRAVWGALKEAVRVVLR